MKVVATHKLADVAKILSGYAFDSGCFADSGDLPIVRIRDVVRGYSNTFYTGDFSETFVVKNGDLLIGMDGEFNAALWRGGRAVLNQRVCKVIPDESVIDKAYLYYLLPKELKAIEDATSFVTVKHLSVKSLQAIEIPLPPLPEQKRIAAILDKADAIRRKRQQAVKLTEELLRSVFLDMFGDPVTNPKGWEVKPLAELVDFTTGKLDSNAAVNDGEYPFFTCSREDLQIDTFAFDCEALLLAGNNASADYSVKYYNGKFNAYQRTYVITMKQPTLSYRYMQYALEMKLSDMKRLSKGTNTKYLTLGILNDMQFHVPDTKTQADFKKTISRLSNTATKFRDAIVISDTLFTSLLQRAFKGEL